MWVSSVRVRIVVPGRDHPGEVDPVKGWEYLIGGEGCRCTRSLSVWKGVRGMRICISPAVGM